MEALVFQSHHKIGPSFVNFKLTGVSLCEYFQYLFINPYRPCQTDPTSSNIVEKLRTTTRWPNECNVLGPACWTQGSGTKIYLKSLENKLSPFWLFQVPFQVINRVTLSLIARGRLFQNLGTATENVWSPEVLHHADVRNLVKTQGITA